MRRNAKWMLSVTLLAAIGLAGSSLFLQAAEKTDPVKIGTQGGFGEEPDAGPYTRDFMMVGSAKDQEVEPTEWTIMHGKMNPITLENKVTLKDTAPGTKVGHAAGVVRGQPNILVNIEGKYQTAGGGAGKPPQWTTTYQRGYATGSLVLIDSNNTDNQVTDPEGDEPLYCTTVDGKGKVQFQLIMENSETDETFDWTITDSNNTTTDGELNKQKGWSDSMANLEPGMYTLAVTKQGASGSDSGSGAQTSWSLEFVVIPGNLTAHRPQHGANYAPFAKTTVSDADEEDAEKGPGIRINNPGDTDPNGEDDLIEVLIERSPADIDVAFRRSSTSLKVWTTRTKSTEVQFTEDKTDALPFAQGETTLTLWVEWAEANHGTADLTLQPLDEDLTLDSLKFHTFKSIIEFLGGRAQVPSDPPNAGHGVFNIAVDLYQSGWDAWMFNQADVTGQGTGPPNEEITEAMTKRNVEKYAVVGHSWGGGATYLLCSALHNAGINADFASYVDAIDRDGWWGEGDRPPGATMVFNHYQTTTFSPQGEDFTGVPGDIQKDVTAMGWLDGNGDPLTHYNIDEDNRVKVDIETTIDGRLDR